MAYDAYDRPLRGGNGEPDYFDTNDSKVPGYSSQYPAEPRENSSSGRRRASSSAQQQQQQRRRSPPIKDSMTSAPERPDPPGHDGVSPELIAAIAERVKREVVEHLKQAGSVDDQQPKAPPLQRAPSNKSSSTSSPPPSSRKVYTPPSPTQAQSQIPKPISIILPPMEPVRSPPSSPLEKPSGVRFSDRTPTARPPPVRTFSNMELSTIDQKWGRLFDNEGNPTQRLGQFLRGLANHIIDDFQPKRSIVVTPAKMAMYYSSHALDTEVHPLVSIFRAQSNEQISQLYQELGCQHHLVQEHSNTAPAVPALTPVGFAHWMTVHILAYPEEESKRLEKVVLAMPVDADGEMVDGKPERLPKQISRHLLPEREDRKLRKLLESAISNLWDELSTSTTSRRKASLTSPPPSDTSTSRSRRATVEIHQVRTSPTQPRERERERERDRNQYAAGAPSASESSSNEEPVKLERDRQPYTAQPGNGKVYTEGSSLNIPTRPSRANSSSSRTRELQEPPESRHHRTKSNASQSYVPPPRTTSRRSSSPPLKSYSNSTPVDIDVSGPRYAAGPSSPTSSFSTQSQPFGSSSHSASNSFPPPPPPLDIRDPRDRRTRDDRQYSRRSTEDEARLAGEFNSPRDTERWDRFQESRASEPERAERPYERGSVSIDPRDSSRDSRGAAYEDWYREKGRGGGYDTYQRY